MKAVAYAAPSLRDTKQSSDQIASYLASTGHHLAMTTRKIKQGIIFV
ncbi:hypothetical protein SAMN04489864_108135 [Pedobacter insulae]|uniref:Uncharacterized protein n=1 Tax=Pedobacter insulae TaxID=414048 RepID=A0A1I2YXF2_9SPHI|nr:hypothetical protein SAMN04489864_108135 [Pedobacter insulae]